MRARLEARQSRCQQQLRSPAPVSLHVAEEPGRCPLCGGLMLVQKTAPRTGRTLAHGPFDARETVHVCAAGCRWPSGARVTRRAACLGEALVPLANVGYDVLVFAGLQRHLHQQRREDIRAALLDRGVPISEGEVSVLSRRFAQYVARLHHARSGELRRALEADVGKDLLEPAHAQLRDLFRRTKVRPKLRNLVRDLGRRIGQDIEPAREAVRQPHSNRFHGLQRDHWRISSSSRHFVAQTW